MKTVYLVHMRGFGKMFPYLHIINFIYSSTGAYASIILLSGFLSITHL